MRIPRDPPQAEVTEADGTFSTRTPANPWHIDNENLHTMMAFTSGALTLVGSIGPVRLLTRTAAWGQERRECSPRTHRQRRSRLAAASLSAEDSVGFAQQPLDLVPDPRERLGSAFEGERLDLVSEKVQPFRDCRAPSLQLGANLLWVDGHASLASTGCWFPSHLVRKPVPPLPPEHQPVLRRPPLQLLLPPELLLQRLHHEVLHCDLAGHAVQLETTVK